MPTRGGSLERRIVTVLFADLVGFTPLAERMDPEDVAAIQDSYFALARDTVARYGGRIDKYIGDAVMAVFGASRSRDDDVERAVRAGLALIHGVQQLNAELGLDEDTLLVRVAANTGEAVLAIEENEDGRVTGDVVNTAQRLQSEAPAGELLVGETTALAIAEVAELGEPISLKLIGKRTKTVARTVQGMLAQPSREQAMGALRAPTVGRGQELTMLEVALDGAAESYLVLDQIKAAKVPVIVHPTMSRVGEEMENVSFETPATLKKAGIPVALQSGYESYVPKTRLVLFEAAEAAANGLSFGAHHHRCGPDPRDRQARRLARGRQGRRRGDLRRRPLRVQLARDRRRGEWRRRQRSAAVAPWLKFSVAPRHAR